MEALFKKNKNLVIAAICWLLILIPVVLVFRNITINLHPFGGDSPYLWSEGLKELITEPNAWTYRSSNFGGVNSILWTSPLMLFYGLVGSTSLIFYIPAVILAVLGPFILARYLGFSRRVGFFSSLFYSLNTYFILLVDGGQAGIALAYGIFPFAVYFSRKYLDKPKIEAFFLSLISLFVLGIADPRVAIICFIFISIWNFRKILLQLPIVISWIGLSAYWLVPLFKNGIDKVNLGTSNVNFFSLLDSVLLFQPHFPGNEFGKLSAPPFYFIGVPIIIFSSLLFAKSKKDYPYYFMFLVFAYFSTGIPFIDKVPFGIAFRDASKLFIPLMLLAGFLIGFTMERINKKLLDIVVYVYLLFLVLPALMGDMNFVLGKTVISNDFIKINDNLKSEDGFFRTAWFSERPPHVFESTKTPGIDAKELIKARPIAAINSSEDVFNFLNNPEFDVYLRTFGIKYLVLSGNPRNLTPSDKDKDHWNEAVELVTNSKSLTKLDWGAIPVYKVEGSFPKFYTFDKLYLVVGPELVNRFGEIPAAVYFEDGQWDPRALEGKNSKSASVILNGKNETDLAMSFLQKYFVSVGEARKNQWAYYSSEKYLKAKYELLIRGIKYKDFDYGLGVAFSTNKNEFVEFEFDVKESGKYVYAVRAMYPENDDIDFGWKTEELDLKKGKYIKKVENLGGMQILNTVALIPKKEFLAGTKLATNFVGHFGVLEEKDITASRRGGISISEFGTSKYKFDNPKSAFWLVLNESYHPLWKLRRGINYFPAVPIYSMQNVFYVDPTWNDLGIEFEGQKNVRWGIYSTAISAIVLVIVYLWKKSKQF